MNGTTRAAVADARDRYRLELADTERWLSYQEARRPDGFHPLDPGQPAPDWLESLPQQKAEAREHIEVLRICLQELEESLLVADVESELLGGEGW